jgi:hypothetical protein
VSLLSRRRVFLEAFVPWLAVSGSLALAERPAWAGQTRWAGTATGVSQSMWWP